MRCDLDNVAEVLQSLKSNLFSMLSDLEGDGVVILAGTLMPFLSK